MPSKKPKAQPVIDSVGRSYLYSDQIGYLIRRAHQHASAIFQEHNAEPQLTPVQFALLLVLATYGSMPQKKVGQYAGVDPSTVTGVVERLRDRGLISVASEATDKRKVILSLSKQGEKVCQRMAEAGHVITEATLAPLTPVERVALQMLLKKLVKLEDDDNS